MGDSATSSGNVSPSPCPGENGIAAHADALASAMQMPSQGRASLGIRGVGVDSSRQHQEAMARLILLQQQQQQQLLAAQQQQQQLLAAQQQQQAALLFPSSSVSDPQLALLRQLQLTGSTSLRHQPVLSSQAQQLLLLRSELRLQEQQQQQQLAMLGGGLRVGLGGGGGGGLFGAATAAGGDSMIALQQTLALHPGTGNGIQTIAGTKTNGLTEDSLSSSTVTAKVSSSKGDDDEEEGEDDPEGQREDAGDNDEDDNDLKSNPDAVNNNDTFPFKLYRMLRDVSKDDQVDTIGWHPDGKSFGIFKPSKFVAAVMPKYFTTGRLSSFQRQLNLYGFKRITEGPYKGGYEHVHFRRGRKTALSKIYRKKSASAKLPSSSAPIGGGGGLIFPGTPASFAAAAANPLAYLQQQQQQLPKTSFELLIHQRQQEQLMKQLQLLQQQERYQNRFLPR